MRPDFGSERLAFWQTRRPKDEAQSADLCSMIEQLTHAFIATDDSYIYLDKTAFGLSHWRQFSQRVTQHCSPHEQFWVFSSLQNPAQLLGFVHVECRHTPDTHAVIGYVSLPQAHGQGFATEATQTVLSHLYNIFPHIQTIRAYCALKNTGSQRVLEKCGLNQIRIIQNHRPPTPTMGPNSYLYELKLPASHEAPRL